MNFDGAIAIVRSCLVAVGKNLNSIDNKERVGAYAKPLAEKIKSARGVEPVCTPQSTLSDIALSLMDSVA